MHPSKYLEDTRGHKNRKMKLRLTHGCI